MRCGKRRPPSSQRRHSSALEQLVDQLAQQCFIEFSAVDPLDRATTIYEGCHRHALSLQQGIESCMARVREEGVRDAKLAGKSKAGCRRVLSVDADDHHPSGIVM